MLDWNTARDIAHGARMLEKTLSTDPESGARTAIVRYPAGLSLPSTFSRACDEELYVLDGRLLIDDIELGPGSYAYIPAGYSRRLTASVEGCDVLTFFEGRADPDPRVREHDPQALIGPIDTRTASWGAATDPKVASANIGRLELRPDSPTGERTWLLRLEVDGGRYPMNGVERHPCVEEMFLLEGDIAMRTGVLRTGAYFWRPAGIPHGPMGSETGFVALFRAKEGAFETEWSETCADVPWGADYAPILPGSIAGRLERDYDTELRY